MTYLAILNERVVQGRLRFLSILEMRALRPQIAYPLFHPKSFTDSACNLWQTLTALLEKYIATIPALNLNGDELEEYSTPAPPEPSGNPRTE